ncbi:hypothetical protein JX265_001906 [Neoarthrinium moseri]|uniref:Uncharacterized protein n=1 Tax=Neoarthrinium moseri TaxID=1658444 RepID=A0A9P9WW13_9PEZI|nr:hypothetical protein JX266_006013 [Neoarthrinium moseri]KAI1880285.1 hypothetical protein JX265_001906 [Neoarthrinium moseri]
MLASHMQRIREGSPNCMFAEDPSITTQAPPSNDQPLYPYDGDGSRDANFANVARDMMSKALGRTPGASSIVEPDSVLGDSGRLYHGYREGKYFLPNDSAEQDRLDLQHKEFEILSDGWLALAPMKVPPRNVIDVACGLWHRALGYAVW